MTSNPADATLRKLFGGAMECLLPAAYVDASEFRQVPDHQEVFVSKEGGISIIIEVLSFETNIDIDVHGKESGQSARHFFNDLVAANGAISSAYDYCGDLTYSIMPKLASYSKSALAGRQTVAKFREETSPEAIRLYLVNVRLPNVDTDLLITVNVPCPDEDTAKRSMASAECFCTDAPPQTETESAGAKEKSPKRAPVPVTLENVDGAKSSEASLIAHVADEPGEGTDFFSKDEVDACQEVEEGRGAHEEVVEGNGSMDASRDSSGVGAGFVENGVRLHPTCGRRDDVDVGVSTLRILLQSFAILDWSLFD